MSRRTRWKAQFAFGKGNLKIPAVTIMARHDAELLPADSGLDRQVERARRGLQEALEAARGARSDWSGTHDGVALLALQLHNPAWCFTSVSNQRSVDRLEISVLAVLSRCVCSNRVCLPGDFWTRQEFPTFCL